jgi:type IX secretion system PorP/SprF family membrane protein
MFNHQSLNPGYSGSKEYTNFTILHRSQWLNFEGAPESQAFTFNHKMTSKNIGFGLSGVNDKIGPMTSSRVALDLAYHLELEKAFFINRDQIGGCKLRFQSVDYSYNKYWG